MILAGCCAGIWMVFKRCLAGVWPVCGRCFDSIPTAFREYSDAHTHNLQSQSQSQSRYHTITQSHNHAITQSHNHTITHTQSHTHSLTITITKKHFLAAFGKRKEREEEQYRTASPRAVRPNLPRRRSLSIAEMWGAKGGGYSLS